MCGSASTPPSERRPRQRVPPPPAVAIGAVQTIALLGRNVPVVPIKGGLRAVSKGEISKPESVARYLASKLGAKLESARTATQRLAASIPADELNEQAFHLYERFRPEVPADERGWGGEGRPRSRHKIDALAQHAKRR